MRIGSSIPLLPSSAPDRGIRTRRDWVEAPPVPADGAEQAPRGEVTRIRSRVAATASTQDFSELPARNRNALQSYLVNGPSLSERLGVELAGIDVQV